MSKLFISKKEKLSILYRVSYAMCIVGSLFTMYVLGYGMGTLTGSLQRLQSLGFGLTLTLVMILWFGGFLGQLWIMIQFKKENKEL